MEGFNPATMKLSFLYFGTRERLSVRDTPEGLRISVEPTGQSLLLRGVSRSQLIPPTWSSTTTRWWKTAWRTPSG